jgi:hypothetical protein
MAKHPKQWLISFSYHAVFYREAGGNNMVGPTSTVVLTDVHPAKYISDMQRDFDVVRSGKGERRGDMLDTVFAMVEVPAGTLSGEEADLLS